MPTYHRILSLVDASKSNSDVVDRAALLSKRYGATLALASVAEPPSDGDTSIRYRLSSLNAATRRVERLASNAGLENSEVLVSERDRHALAATVAAWRPDLLVLGAATPVGMQGWLEILRELQSEHDHFDVLTVEPQHSSFARRVAGVLAGLF